MSEITNSGGRTRLMLSGGGNRAIVGSIGAAAYLAQSGWWESIDEIVSVSGGSTTNGALITGGDDTAEQTLDTLAAYFKEVSTDIGQPWKSPKRIGAIATILAPLVLIVGFVLMSLGIMPGPALARNSLVALVVGLLAPMALSTFGRRGAGSYFRNYLGTLTGGRNQSLSTFNGRNRQHVICASGFASAQPYYLWAGGSDFYAGGDLAGPRKSHDSQTLWGAPLQEDVDIADAAFASASLPGIAQIKTKLQSPNRVVDSGTEMLVDGGVSGIFGSQVAAGLQQQTDHRNSDRSGHIIVIDAGRHVKPPPRIVRVLQRFSMIGLLSRWLKVSLEATYVDDLQELENTNLVRIAEGHDEAIDDETDAYRRFDELRRRTAAMGLLNYNAEKARNAFVTGWVGSALSLDPDTDADAIEDGLKVVGERFSVGAYFSQYWISLKGVN